MNFAKTPGKILAKTILFFIFFFYQYFVPSGTISVLSKSIEQEEISKSKNERNSIFHLNIQIIAFLDFVP